MSVFTRVLSRAAVRGGAATVSAWPKGSPMPVRRQDDDVDADAQRHRLVRPALVHRLEDEDTARPLRRQEQDDEASALRREEEHDEAHDEVTALRREEGDDEASALRREEEHDEAQALRREEEADGAQPRDRRDEDAEARTLRREDDVEEAHDGAHEEAHDAAARPVRRSGGGDPMGTVPVEPSSAWDDGPREELPDMRALRRNVGAAIAGPEASSVQDPPPDGGSAIGGPFVPPQLDDPPGASALPPVPPGSSSERPRVTIDQIDVVIHETAPAASTSSPSLADLSRRMNARYLRRL